MVSLNQSISTYLSYSMVGVKITSQSNEFEEVSQNILKFCKKIKHWPIDIPVKYERIYNEFLNTRFVTRVLDSKI